MHGDIDATIPTVPCRIPTLVPGMPPAIVCATKLHALAWLQKTRIYTFGVSSQCHIVVRGSFVLDVSVSIIMLEECTYDYLVSVY